MKKSKDVFKLVMVIVLIVSMFVACSNNNNTANNKGNADSKSNKTVKENDTAVEPAAVDPNEPTWKKDTSPITFDWYLNFSWFPNKWGVDPTSKYITEKTGVDIN